MYKEIEPSTEQSQWHSCVTNHHVKLALPLPHNLRPVQQTVSSLQDSRLLTPILRNLWLSGNKGTERKKKNGAIVITDVRDTMLLHLTGKPEMVFSMWSKVRQF